MDGETTGACVGATLAWAAGVTVGPETEGTIPRYTEEAAAGGSNVGLCGAVTCVGSDVRLGLGVGVGGTGVRVGRGVAVGGSGVGEGRRVAVGVGSSNVGDGRGGASAVDVASKAD